MACWFPFMVKTPHRYLHEGFSSIPVPCGKCYDCKMRIISQWCFRLRQEEKVADSAVFLTLTYDTVHVPITENGFMTLRLDDVQKYFKRLRKKHPRGHRLSYFVAGEYGSARSRPHYHVILFNCDPQYIESAWAINGVPIGNCYVGTVTGASIAYTLKYMLKDPKGKKHARDDRKREFRVMSKGLGLNYLTKSMVHYHRQNEEKLYSVIEDGIKVPLSRYYRKRIWSEAEQVNQGALVRARIQNLMYKNTEKDVNYVEKERAGAEVRNKRSIGKNKDRGVD